MNRSLTKTIPSKNVSQQEDFDRDKSSSPDLAAPPNLSKIRSQPNNNSNVSTDF